MLSVSSSTIFLLHISHFTFHKRFVGLSSSHSAFMMANSHTELVTDFVWVSHHLPSMNFSLIPLLLVFAFFFSSIFREMIKHPTFWCELFVTLVQILIYMFVKHVYTYAFIEFFHLIGLLGKYRN